MASAEGVVEALRERGLTVATAESLTGGLVCARLTAVPGASVVVVGGVVAYANEAKERIAGVDHAVLAEHGPVAAETAAAMAQGVRELLGAGISLATTGVAGPTEQDGHPPGTVHVAAAAPDGTDVRSFTGGECLRGDRAAVRERTVSVALEMLLSAALRASPK
ncbi:CinA family protein [Phytoactinopolyspora mesophila]|uniref:Nicotinamide-nucleotide amidohydrolase family protein n=1 Tax=Phytoactinopolyspora mesophila TaxID=2650750 RepID=A0A7K3M7I8_9ACTN|nr:CinA family protein [Phytoactinopolyspora mesophila]NDL59245.1 nicotinamide-nucleotide amidohydrolase family protein [Phytoactinopolyspora mesophila]